MEPLPNKPTLIPQARRYTRIFRSSHSRIFREGDEIDIDIPPIKNTYLSKDSQLYFATGVDFIAASKEAYQAIAELLYDIGFENGYQNVNGGNILTGFNAGLQNVKDFFRASGFSALGPYYGSDELKKMVPTLATCGPYGFFSEVRVYDYLGNTLLETLKSHDLWSSLMADFVNWDPSIQAVRPPVTTLTSSGTPFETRFPAINYLDVSNFGADWEFTMSEAPAVQLNIPTVGTYVPGWQWISAVAEFTTSPRVWNIDLLTFLGKGSKKFSPLHNGYTIKFIVNRPNIPLVMANGLGLDNYFVDNQGGVGPDSQPILLGGTVSDCSIYDVYLRSDLLEITPELDKQVDKILHCDMLEYMQQPSTPTSIKLPFYKKSLKQIIAFERLVETYGIADSIDASYSLYRRYPNDSHEKLGYRVNNSISNVLLEYDGAKVIEFTKSNQNLYALFRYLGPDFIKCYCDQSFNLPLNVITDPTFGVGTFGLQTLFYPQSIMEERWLQSGSTIPYATNNNFTRELITHIKPLNMGKFVIPLDLELPGFQQQKNICGIDTTKSFLTLTLKRTKDFMPNVTNLDIFCKYDAFIHIDPGVSSSVSF
jgi:hypothetical protein